MHNDLISIAMCTYNGDKYIQEQLESILQQTYQNFELIITDDCSSDNTIKIIQKYQNKDSRIKLYQNSINLGFVKNFEKAMSLCTGEYIALSDQDDKWHHDKLNLFINEIKENVLIYSDAILIDKNGKETGGQLIQPDSHLVSGNVNKAFLFLNCVSGNTLMFKKEILKHLIPIPENAQYHDSWIAFVASTYGSITFTHKPMTYYRRYTEQVTNQVEIKYKNFFDKLEQKKKGKLNFAKAIVNNIDSYLSLTILKDKETIKTMKLIKEHYTKYEDIYYNKALHKALKKHKEEIFAITSPNKRTKRAFRTALGLKFRALTLYKV